MKSELYLNYVFDEIEKGSYIRDVMEVWIEEKLTASGRVETKERKEE